MNKVIRMTLTGVLALGVLAIAGCTRSYSRPPRNLAANQTVQGSEQKNAPPASALSEIPAAEAAATEAPIPPQPTARVYPTPERPESYVLQNGEYPICIARRYDLDLDRMITVNNLTLDSRPSAGVKLQLPAEGAWADEKLGGRGLREHAPYTVRAGDTVNTIACYYGDVYPEVILMANDLPDGGAITPGQQLTIP